MLKPSASIISHFANIPDLRLNRRKWHQLGGIFFIALCGVICGADDWVVIETFGKVKQAWFTEVLGLKHSIPSHDTFGDSA